MPKTIYVSKRGYASCPACLNHIKLDPKREETTCPFCDEALTLAAAASTEGSRTMEVLRNSRSGLVASALLGAGLSLSVACSDADDPDTGEEDAGWNVEEDAGDDDAGTNFQEQDADHNIMQDYGDFPNDFNYGEEPNATDPDAGVEEDVEDGEDGEEPDEED